MMKFRIGIFAKTEHRANLAFDRILNNIESKQIKCISLKEEGPECELTNGVFIKVIVASDNVRGCRFDRIIYDDEIDKEVLDYIVRPCLATPMWSFKRAGLDL